ncbi:exopolysaccharide biosynthesis protein [Rhodovulum sulfidophilum]|uniref:exopolysaccharide biosynthesis protein n=1 Tax=Rhodovulum sulfidophilum TaxID=35806 RepID=UPI00138A4558|nr:exopolysaccharide biosynthesis protein [Rhodovulum sulfidophilum]MCE8417636.1 exopolysaccharide biosynthesis protein [Rhodovulum sulfidophilum]NDK34369.1 exopolysaccharide biosynthesis protein [Rhodovulum sulfidophilum]
MNSQDDWIISSLLEDLAALALANDRISIADLVEALGARGFGPLLVMLSAFLILPVGMLPGLPGVVAIFMILIGGRMMTGETTLWLPARLRRVHISGHVLAVSVARAQPAALWLRPLLTPRLVALIEGRIATRLIALILIGTGVLIFLLGFIPGLPFVLSLHVLMLGLALSTRDGLVAALAYALMVPEIIFIWRVFT